MMAEFFKESVVLGMECRIFCMLGKLSTTESPELLSFLKQNFTMKALSQISFKLKIFLPLPPAC